MVGHRLGMYDRNSAVFGWMGDCLCKNVLKGAILTMGERTKVTPVLPHLRQILVTPTDSFVQNHGRVHPRAPAMSMPRAESLYREYAKYLVCGNNDVNAIEYIIPYPLFSPEFNIVGPRKYPCLKSRQLGRQRLMLLDG